MGSEEEKTRVSDEACAYTPGLKVKRSTTVSKTRRLPIPGVVHVKSGDKVNYEAVVAGTMVRGDPEMVNGAMLLNVEPLDLPRYMAKKEGDHVAKGEVIATYSSLFGLIKKQLSSPVEGNIESISDTTGIVVIRKSPVPVEVRAFIPGAVVKVLPKEGATIETNAALVQGIFGIGGETHGRIEMAVDSPSEELTADKITAKNKGTVLIGGSYVTLEALNKGTQVGVSCIVAGGIDHKDLVAFLGRDIGVAITGQEEVGLTLIITEGFGKMNMSRRTFDLLKSFKGHIACANGTTQIRAGVLRPEIIIPHELESQQLTGDKLMAGMVPGTAVRIIRQPYFGAIGKVSRLPVELRKLESESKVRVLDVELDDGRVVTIPRANVEIIEE